MWDDARRACAGVLVLLILANCGGSGVRDGTPSSSETVRNLPQDAVPKPEDRSRYGNGPTYEVLGKRYAVMSSGAGYSERGVASWYGQKFHGRLTSNQETYDMYAMTAAHKTLPLPTYVRVRNLSNNKSTVVRVNDRGPFAHNRIIDLSYSAAMKLDMVRDGTSLVEVTAITFDDSPGDQPTRHQISPQTVPPVTPPPVDPTPAEPETVDENQIFVQVGAFGSRENAEQRSAALASAHIGNVSIHADTSVFPTLYRVQIGPIWDAVQYDVIVDELENIGIPDPYLITD